MRTGLILISVLLASCSEMSVPTLTSLTPRKIDIQQGNLISPEMRDRVQPGMSAATVRSILGTPLIRDPFHAGRWDYAYSLEKGGKLVARQRLTLYFRNDRLVRIDDSGMPAPIASAPAAEKK